MSANSRCPTGSRVWLNGESRLKYPGGSSPARRERSPSRAKPSSKSAKTPCGRSASTWTTCRSRSWGTSFDAIGYSFGSHQEIILKTGSVKVSGRRPRQTRPAAARRKIIAGHPHPASLRPAGRRPELLQLVRIPPDLRQHTARDIITNLERRYNVEIALSSHIRVDKRLSLVVYHEPLEDILDVMATLIPIRYRIDGNQVLITKK